MAERIIVVDDDPLVGGLTLDLLKDAGYDVELIQNSLQAMDAIRQKRPAMAILDVLMPGVDGLTLCQQIKNDPELKSMKIAIVSGKSFQQDKDRAIRLGADIFIEKPYRVEALAQQIRNVLDKSAANQPAPEKASPPAPKNQIKATIWGCRAKTTANQSRFGNRTPCVSIEFGGRLFVFDAGAGLKSLAAEVMRSRRYKDIWLFLTHFHSDHLEALEDFACARAEGYNLYISGANDTDKKLQDAVQEAFERSAASGPLAANIELYEMMEETYEILPGVKVAAFYANHPSTTLGYKIDTGGRRIVYCPDSEIYGDAATALQDYDEKLGGICYDADLLIHNARYTEADYATQKNTGHSNFMSVIKFAVRNHVKKLVLFHLDSKYSDDELDEMINQGQAMIAEKGYNLQCHMATEGLSLVI